VPELIDQRYDFIRYVNSTLHDAIRSADRKALASMALAVAGIAASVLTKSFTAFTQGPVDRAEFHLAIGAYVLLLIAFGTGAIVIFPRISRDAPRGWIFWEYITAYDREAYARSLEEATVEEIRKALAEHSYVAAKILVQKYAWLRASIWTASLGSILAAATQVLMCPVGRGL
jgi:hypothetical protein